MEPSSSDHDRVEDARESPIVYIFVNPTSGGNRASEYLTLGLQRMKFRENHCEVYIYDISDGVSGSKPSFANLADHAAANTGDNGSSHPIRVLVAGGDGSIMWFLDEAIKHKVDIDSIAIGVIPFGTANDFSRVLGWGASAPRVLLGKRLVNFKGMLTQWLNASIVPYDIWEVEIKCTNNGSIQHIHNSVKTPLKGSNGEILRDVVKPICNYFSIGVESRIGLGFDKHRTKSKLLNKAVYVVEGTKKLTFTRTPPIPDLISSATCPSIVDQPSGEDRNIFTTNAVGERSHLIGNPVSIIMLNIPSIMGGCDIWSKSRKIGIRNDTQSGLLDKLQDPGDGKFEMLSYDTLFGLSAEQLRISPFAGNGHRLYQGGGPVVLQFKALNDSIRAYFQVDGEYYMCKHPSTMTIRHKMKIHVMKRNT
ncbi:diacylglycerol kinase, epsilon, putative [Perkinsus marinus ATCC 50983]|uniref:Diacylglycerol kinase n=1 Tax=Perkinsus marinus (strain ATCC 50983 / TXsc) TaxID=423536 RepID=C5LGR4_PERM5|nr:diacylglycerol kinase, epsilon, putative [Perkinsus marinus ATCC 50983]EER04109.1 diacylglycerol kinase, epsilon, putative [Perkinsus marinus ATCC 50983]|eukprot:XP_002772293.1 diacylglycerol kinase, epsilon, putative [Perkinsus marinus ATCC 50983]